MRRVIVKPKEHRQFLELAEQGTLSLECVGLKMFKSLAVSKRPRTVITEETSCSFLPGRGPQFVDTFVIPDMVSSFIEALRECDASTLTVERYLGKTEKIASAASGLKEPYDGLLGTFNVLTRAQQSLHWEQVPIELNWKKPSIESPEPITEGKFSRQNDDDVSEYVIHFIGRSFESVVADRILRLDSNEHSLDIKCNQHITGAEFRVFDPRIGSLIQHSHHVYLQGLQLGLQGITQTDYIPLDIASAKEKMDLVYRARKSYSQSSIGVSSAKAMAAAEIRKSHQLLKSRLGQSTEAQSRWFERTISEELEVIRWLRERIEDPSIARSILADPFLGSDAFARMLVRIGSDMASLTVLVSPGNFDPDNPDVAKVDRGRRYLEHLKAAIAANEHLIVGELKFLHIRRGTGSRQAFHDRYLCQLDHQDVPTVWCLSNSLSKAAGEWPFCVSRLASRDAWAVKDYLDDLIQGIDRQDRELKVETVWDSKLQPKRELSESISIDCPHLFRWLIGRQGNWQKRVAKAGWIGEVSREACDSFGKAVAQAWLKRTPRNAKNGVRLVRELLEVGSKMGQFYWPDGLKEIASAWDKSWSMEALNHIETSTLSSPWFFSASDEKCIELMFLQDISAATLPAVVRLATMPIQANSSVHLAKLLWQIDPNAIEKHYDQIKSITGRYVLYRGLLEAVSTLPDPGTKIRTVLLGSRFAGIRLHGLLQWDPLFLSWHRTQVDEDIRKGFETAVEAVICCTADWRYAVAKCRDAIIYEQEPEEVAKAVQVEQSALTYLIESWSATEDPQKLALAFFTVCDGRFAEVDAVRSRLEQARLQSSADHIMALFSDQMFARLTANNSNWGSMLTTRNGLIELEKGAIAFAQARKRPTMDIARDLNPLMFKLLNLLQTFDCCHTLSNEIAEELSSPASALESALTGSIFALQVSLSLDRTDPKIMDWIQVLAVDYTNTIAIILRSSTFARLYPPERKDRAYLMKKIIGILNDVRKELANEDLENAWEIIAKDTLLPREFHTKNIGSK